MTKKITTDAKAPKTNDRMPNPYGPATGTPTPDPYVTPDKPTSGDTYKGNRAPDGRVTEGYVDAGPATGTEGTGRGDPVHK